MSGHEKYVIRPGVEGEVSTGQAGHIFPFSQLEGRRRIINAKRRTFAFTAIIWTTFGAYAYYTHTHRIPKEVTEEEKLAKEEAHAEEQRASQEKIESFGLFTPLHNSTELQVTPENFFDICPSRNPRVILNSVLGMYELRHYQFLSILNMDCSFSFYSKL